MRPELAEPVSRADLIVFIDCSREGRPGEFHCDELRPESGQVPFTHHLSPTAILEMSSELYGSCPKAYIVSICGESFDPGESLSPVVERRLPELKARLRELITDALGRSMAARCAETVMGSTNATDLAPA